MLQWHKLCLPFIQDMPVKCLFLHVEYAIILFLSVFIGISVLFKLNYDDFGKRKAILRMMVYLIMQTKGTKGICFQQVR